MINPRRRLIYQRAPHQLSARLGDYEEAMLEGLARHWRCTKSEAVRRAIVYAFTKIVAGLEPVDEGALRRALRIALEHLNRRAGS